MHSAIFIVKDPFEKGWDDFEARIKGKLEPRENDQKYAGSIQRLGPNVWLLNVTKSPAPLGWLIGFAEQFGFAYGILPFSDARRQLETAITPWFSDGGRA